MTGTLIPLNSQGRAKAFIPHPLPPEPPLHFDAPTLDLLEKANRAIGRLDGLTALLPDPSLFIYFYVRKEAVLSSQIEGTQSSLSDLLLFEGEHRLGVPEDDVQQVSSYVQALELGLQRLRGGFPLSLRLIREIHAVLLQNGRGSKRTPGEFRRVQNWIGGKDPEEAVFVPPPPNHLDECLSAFESFLHDSEVRTPTLVKAALAHVQFETIHPFLDGNGRLGRLLIAFLLSAEKVLQEPILYLSLFFKKHRAEYYQHLQRVRELGDWEGWLSFFLEGVVETASSAVETARQIQNLFQEDRERIESQTGQAAGSVLRIHSLLQRSPVAGTVSLREQSGLSHPTVLSALKTLDTLDVVSEISGRKSRKVFAYRAYLQLLSEGS